MLNLSKDGVIEKMFVEREGFEAMPVVSNAETMLNSINQSPAIRVQAT